MALDVDCRLLEFSADRRTFAIRRHDEIAAAMTGLKQPHRSDQGSEKCDWAEAETEGTDVPEHYRWADLTMQVRDPDL